MGERQTEREKVGGWELGNNKNNGDFFFLWVKPSYYNSFRVATLVCTYADFFFAQHISSQIVLVSLKLALCSQQQIRLPRVESAHGIKFLHDGGESVDVALDTSLLQVPM